MRAAQKIFQDDFTPELALTVLAETWATASESQKQNWRRSNFQSSVVKPTPQALNMPTTKDELIRVYEELCEECLEALLLASAET
ncbi:MAG: hypothetical protein H0X26_08975 [Alphaproteobacteria bacterium]|nr:hypothetical protein [Alphaproteobacteria bacterium]